MSINKTTCPKCKPEMGLKCGACAVRQHAKEINTDRQLCALRELVLAHHAFARAYAEFFLAIDPAAKRDDFESKEERIVREWLASESPDDARELSTHDLAVLRKRVLYA